LTNKINIAILSIAVISVADIKGLPPYSGQINIFQATQEGLWPIQRAYPRGSYR
jgi:hypothetical protein